MVNNNNLICVHAAKLVHICKHMRAQFGSEHYYSIIHMKTIQKICFHLFERQRSSSMGLMFISINFIMRQYIALGIIMALWWKTKPFHTHTHTHTLTHLEIVSLEYAMNKRKDNWFCIIYLRCHLVCLMNAFNLIWKRI